MPDAGQLERLAEIRARCEKATDGPWAYEAVSDKSNEWCLGVVVGEDDTPLSGQIEQGQGIIDYAIVREAIGLEDAAFIAHARQDIPWLLDQLAASPSPVSAPSDLVKLLDEGEDDRAGLCTNFDGCWHCRVVECLRALSQRMDGYGPAKIVAPKDTSDESIRQAALETASGIGLFAATWPEFYEFGRAVAALASPAPSPVSAWQPISSAPKDGTPFIAACRMDAFRAFYDTEQEVWVCEDDGIWFGALPIPPTHWASLPPEDNA